MDPIQLTLIGLTAAFFTSIAWIPQVMKTFRTKSTRDISLHLMLVVSIGLSLWLIYGILLEDVAIIISNSVQVPMTYWLLGMKIRHG
jgi:MtN3 and saliva related transmembrane protein